MLCNADTEDKVAGNVLCTFLCSFYLQKIQDLTYGGLQQLKHIIAPMPNGNP